MCGLPVTCPFLDHPPDALTELVGEPKLAIALMLLFVLFLHLFWVEHCGTPRGPKALSVCAVHRAAVVPKLADMLMLPPRHLLHFFSAEHCGTPREPGALPVLAVPMALTAVGCVAAARLADAPALSLKGH